MSMFFKYNKEDDGLYPARKENPEDKISTGAYAAGRKHEITAKSAHNTAFTEEFSCQYCDQIVHKEGDLCPECYQEEVEAMKDAEFDARVVLGTI